MKKYIAFIVADVVLLACTCYITYSHTTQENELTPEEREKSLAILKRSAMIANHRGQQVMDDCNGSAAVSATAAAIMLSAFCAEAEMSMHDAMGLFMSIHKQTEAMAGGKA